MDRGRSLCADGGHGRAHAERGRSEAAAARRTHPSGRRPRDDSRHGPRPPRTVSRRSEVQRVRALRGRRQADAGHVLALARRTRLRRRAASGAGARGPGASRLTSSQRCFRTHLSDLHRRPAPRGQPDAARARPVRPDHEAPRPCRRHVRHRLDRPLLDRGRPDLRPEAPRSGGQEDHGERAHRHGRARHTQRGRWPGRRAASRPRCLQHGLRLDGQPRQDSRPAQGDDLPEQWL